MTPYSVRVGDKFLGKMGMTAALGPVGAPFAYSWDLPMALEVAIANDGVVTTVPKYNAKTKGYDFTEVIS